MLQHCFPQSIRRTLDELPNSLDETYGRVLKEIGLVNRVHAHHLLQCLTVAIRPLRVDELAEILALDFDVAEGMTPRLNADWRWKDRQRAVLSACSSLIMLVNDGDSRVIQFSHFSVKEFLISDRLSTSTGGVSHFHITPEPAHMTLAQACLATLLQLDGSSTNDHVKDSFPLARYASQHWVEHAQFGMVSSRIEDGMRRLFDPDHAEMRYEPADYAGTGRRPGGQVLRCKHHKRPNFWNTVFAPLRYHFGLTYFHFTVTRLPSVSSTSAPSP